MKLLYVLLLTATAFAQLPPTAVVQNSKPDSEKIWRIDAVARDASGREVTDLKASDFQVSQEGVALKVLDAVHVDAEAPRTFVLIVDDYNLSNEALDRVRDALLGFVDRKTRPADRISILRTRSGLGALQDLTEDRTVLHRAAAAIHAAVPQGTSVAQRFSVLTAGTLRLALIGARRIEGRKIVILFSQRFRSLDLKEPEALTKWADASEALVYLVAMGEAAGDAKPLVESELEIVARMSGGKTVEGGGDPAAALDTLLQDVTGYYNIRFEGGTQYYDYPTGSVRTEHLAVSALRPGVTLASRASDVLPGSEEFPVTPDEDLARALRSPFEAAGLNVRISPYVTRDAQNKAYVETAVWVDTATLSSTRGVSGGPKAMAELGLVTFSHAGTTAEGSGRLLALNLAPEEEASSKGILTSIAVKEHPAGLHLLRVVVVDELNGRVGQATTVIDVPPSGPGKLAVGALPLRRPADDAAKWKNDIPEVRIFEAGGAVIYACRVYNVTVTPENRSRLESTVKVYREGRLIFSGSPTVTEFEPAANPQQRVLGGTVNFGAQPSPGEYTIELSVTDRLAPSPVRAVASQTVELRR